MEEKHTMKTSQRLTVRSSEIRARLNELSALDELNDETRAELDALSREYKDVEARLRAATIAESDEERRALEAQPDAEMRERLELRGKASLTNFLIAAAQGRMVDGVERELQQAAGVNQIPIELFDVDVPKREVRADVATPAPGTGTGVNLSPIFPSIFARAVLPRLGVAMPRTPSGTFATGTVTTDLTAAAVEAGTAQESTAAAITTKTTTPHRVTARLSIRLEDVATIGTGNFESILRQNLSMAMSDRLDFLGLTGDGRNANPQGLLSQLTDPTDPTAVVKFDGFVALAAYGIDGGPWAETMQAVRVLVNASTMRLAETTFQSTNTYKGELSAAAYLRQHAGGFFSSSRMPATASNIAQCLRYRAGTMGLDGVNAMQTATCPVWNELGIDDIYSDAASGTRHFTLHTLIGDVLIIQSDAYERVDLKVS
ncbi:MAG: hypothetical protein F4224_09500 [Nitrospira sp. SB0678_bin_10]|nr:hypothetical protein [Nitrospira sp. SB0678_bin_10]